MGYNGSQRFRCVWIVNDINSNLCNGFLEPILTLICCAYLRDRWNTKLYDRAPLVDLPWSSHLN